MGRLLITILLSAIGISANARGDWWIEAEDASSSVSTQDGVTTIIAPHERKR